MKILPTPLFLIIPLFFSCSSDDPQAVKENIDDQATKEVTDDANDGQTGDTDELTLSLVEAFSQLSFDKPLDLQSPDDGANNIFIVEKDGKIKVFSNDDSASEAKIFLDLGSTLSTAGEQGLLGLAFHPDYATNGFFYVCYTPTQTLSVISRFSVSGSDGSLADSSSEVVFLKIPQPFTNHNGGQIAFGPDGYLYIASGDGGSGGDPLNNGQTTTTVLGNILRIDVDTPSDGNCYSIPTDNPFVDDSGVLDEIYAYGFRNPWRMSFDTQTGNLWAADVGQGTIEEIDIVEAGQNYGWNKFEGTACFSGDCDTSGVTMPIFEYDHSNGDRSITGGYVYRGPTNTSLQGKYIYGDFASGRIWALETDGSMNELLIESGLGIASFGTDAQQELYICAFDGKIYKFEEN